MPQVTKSPLTDPKTFLALGLHAAAQDDDHQPPRLTVREALAELAVDCKRAELRVLMEQR